MKFADRVAMRRAMSRRMILVATAAGLLAACSTTVPPGGFPDLAYSHLPPINLAVARVDVVQEYRPPGKKPNVEHLFPVVPALAAERWARDRLKAVGGEGVARVTISRASAVEVPLNRTPGLPGVFTTDQSERYDAVIEIKIDILAGDGREAASVAARAERRRTVPENITLLGREKVWFEMTEAMMNDLNASLERQIQENFGRWLVRSGGGAPAGGSRPAGGGPAGAGSGGSTGAPVTTTPLQ